MNSPLRIAIVGVGGFAGVHHSAIASIEQTGEARLVATCDPSPEALTKADAKWNFATRGVRMYSDYLTMLAAHRSELDAFIVPTPVPLHAEMHRAGVEHGIAVYLEKPPTLDWEELGTMIAVEKSARRPTNVGFNHIVEPVRRALKRRLCAGEFGTLREVRFIGLSGRPEEYYARNGWAGRLMLGDQIVIDSCFTNAMAHYVHNILFWAGVDTEMSWASATTVEAALYRTNTIECADTVLVAARTSTGVGLRIGMTHAWAGDDRVCESLICDRATIRYRVDQHAEIEWSTGERETIPTTPGPSLRVNLQAWFSYLRGETSRPSTLLTDCRPFVHLSSLAILSSGNIFPLAYECHRSRWGAGEGTFRVASAVENMIELFVNQGQWPAPAPSRVSTSADLPRLRGMLQLLLLDLQPVSSYLRT